MWAHSEKAKKTFALKDTKSDHEELTSHLFPVLRLESENTNLGLFVLFLFNKINWFEPVNLLLQEFYFFPQIDKCAKQTSW